MNDTQRRVAAGFLAGAAVAAIAVAAFWSLRAGEVPPAPLAAPSATAPGDLASRKELALTLLAGDQLMAAFEQASEILRVLPDDPDGLYVHGVVRLRMGQSVRSIQLLERLLAGHPDHVPARVTLGKAQRRIGDEAGALRTWTRALADAGGRHTEIERLLAGAS